MSELLKFPESSAKVPFEPDPERGVGHQVRTTYKLLTRVMELRFADFDITPAQWFLIKVLLEEDGLTQGELGRRVGAMANTILVALKPLERRGLIVRKGNPQDRRKINIFLTDEGKALKFKLQPIAHEINAIAVGSMLNHEVRAAKQLMVAIQRNLMAELTELTESPRKSVQAAGERRGRQPRRRTGA